MSRVGKMPIAIPAGVTVEVAENNTVTVKGPKGTLTRTLPADMKISEENGELKVERPNDQKRERSMHGLTRALLNNMVVGVTDGFTKELEVNGVGYRAAKAGKKLTLSLGYSHPIEMEDPEGVETVVDGTRSWDSSRRRSERRENRSLTRARVSSMLRSASVARSVRPVRRLNG